MDTETRINISVRDILHVIFKRKALILLLFGVTVCAGAIASFMRTPMYEATAQILIKVGRENVYVPAAGEGGPIVDKGNQMRAEIEILESRFLAERVVKSLGPAVFYEDLDSVGQELQNNAVTRLQKGLTVSGIGETNVINISFTHTNPRLAAKVLDTLVSFYLERHLEVHKRHDPQGFFQKQYLLLKDQTKLAEEKLQTFRNEHDLTALDEEQSLLLKQEADLSTELNRTLSQEAEIKNRIRQLRHQLAMPIETIPMNDPRISTLQSRLVELELQENELLTKYSDQSRLVKHVREEIAIVRRKLAEQKPAIILQEILRNEVELQALKGKVETQRAQLTAIRKRHEKLNRLVLQFDRLRQAVEVLREKYRLYLTKFEEARISEAMDKEKIANVRLIEPVYIPIKPIDSTIGLNIMLAVILGTVGGLGMGLFLEYLEDSLERDEDVESLLHLPLLASIPELKS